MREVYDIILRLFGSDSQKEETGLKVNMKFASWHFFYTDSSDEFQGTQVRRLFTEADKDTIANIKIKLFGRGHGTQRIFFYEPVEISNSQPGVQYLAVRLAACWCPYCCNAVQNRIQHHPRNEVDVFQCLSKERALDCHIDH